MALSPILIYQYIFKRLTLFPFISPFKFPVVSEQNDLTVYADITPLDVSVLHGVLL